VGARTGFWVRAPAVQHPAPRAPQIGEPGNGFQSPPQGRSGPPDLIILAVTRGGILVAHHSPNPQSVSQPLRSLT
jgi:hypothetical protein